MVRRWGALPVAAAALVLAALALPAAADESGTEAPPTPAEAPSGLDSANTTISVASEVEYRQAIIDLSLDGAGPHVIEITADFTIGSAGDPTYDGSQALTISGNGHTVTSGVADTRFLEFNSSADLTVEDLTVTGFERESAGAAIESDSDITSIVRSTFSDNSSLVDGGAIDAEFDVVVDQSTFSDNEAGDGEGGAIDQSEEGLIEITSSSFIDNEAGGDGGAVSAEDGISATNSTFSGNEGQTALNTGNAATMTLIYVTVSGSEVGAAALLGDGDLDGFGTVIADTTGGDNCFFDGVSTLEWSYSTDDTCLDLGQPGNTENGNNPGLEEPAANGGPTPTMAIGEDGDLFDAITAEACTTEGITVDQRGEPRPGEGTDACDIGAYEIQAMTPPPPPPPPAPPTPGTGPISAAPGFTG